MQIFTPGPGGDLHQDLPDESRIPGHQGGRVGLRGLLPHRRHGLLRQGRDHSLRGAGDGQQMVFV